MTQHQFGVIGESHPRRVYYLACNIFGHVKNWSDGVSEHDLSGQLGWGGENPSGREVR